MKRTPEPGLAVRRRPGVTPGGWRLTSQRRGIASWAAGGCAAGGPRICLRSRASRPGSFTGTGQAGWPPRRTSRPAGSQGKSRVCGQAGQAEAAPGVKFKPAARAGPRVRLPLPRLVSPGSRRCPATDREESGAALAPPPSPASPTRKPARRERTRAEQPALRPAPGRP